MARDTRDTQGKKATPTPKVPAPTTPTPKPPIPIVPKPRTPAPISRITPVDDSRAALNKLTGGQTLTAEERKILNLSPLDTIPEMPSDADMAAADAAYESARADLGLPPTPPKIIPPTRTLAIDTFRNTLSGLFAPGEMSSVWVDALYGVVSGYYNTGSTIPDAFNLALRDAETDKRLAPFAERFAPIFAIRKRQQAGEAVAVPTIEQYVASEIDLGDIMREVGLGELATTKFLGSVLTTKSVLTATNLISDIFKRIDNAPEALKTDLTSVMNLGVSRVDIAKALLTGKEGADALDKKVKQLSVFSAAKTQGVGIDMGTASDLANMGNNYGNALEGFQTVKQLERGQALGRMSGREYGQSDAIQSTFYANASAAEKERIIKEEEQNRFEAKTGYLKSQNRNISGQI